MRLDHLLSKELFAGLWILSESKLSHSQLITSYLAPLAIVFLAGPSPRKAGVSRTCQPLFRFLGAWLPEAHTSSPALGRRTCLCQQRYRRPDRVDLCQATATSASLTDLFPTRAAAASNTLPAPRLPLENSIASTSIFVFPSYKEPTVDALAPEADEGRGWLR